MRFFRCACVVVVFYASIIGCSRKPGYAEFTFEGKALRFDNVYFASGLAPDTQEWHCALKSPMHEANYSRPEPSNHWSPEFTLGFKAAQSNISTIRDLSGKTFGGPILLIFFEEGKIGESGMIGEDKFISDMQIHIRMADENRLTGDFSGKLLFQSSDFAQTRIISVTDGVFDVPVSKEDLWRAEKGLR